MADPANPAPAEPVGYAFEAALHPRPVAVRFGGSHVDALGTWPVLDVARVALAEPFAIGFDAALERLGELPGMFAEPDGAFVWTAGQGRPPWQVDGTMLERAGRVLLVDVKGACPEGEFDRLLAAFGWPTCPVMFQLVRPAVFLDEADFRRHARGRWLAGDAQTLRPG